MLGAAVADAATRNGHTVAATTRREVDLLDRGRIVQMRDAFEPEAIINCAGVRAGTEEALVHGNAIIPHNLADVGVRLVHMSTDCVYSGKETPRKEHPDPDTMYGRTKLVGESLRDRVLNVRGSFIGTKHGFLQWALTAPGPLKGWTNALWSGGSVSVIADVLVALADQTDKTGVIHVAAPHSVSKYQMLIWACREAGRLGVEVEKVVTPYIDRTLAPDIELPEVEWSVRHEIKGWLAASP